MNELRAVPSVALPLQIGAAKDREVKFEAWMFWAIWLSTWFSPLKLNIGLNLAVEFLLAYLLALYYLMLGRFSIAQVVGVLGLGFIAVLDYMRNQDLKVFMFLGFACVNFSMVEFARRPVISALRFNCFFLLVPVLAVLMRYLMPETGGIYTHDQLVVGEENVQRFNLLGYESNSLATMMTMLLGAVLGGVGQLKLIWRIAYSLFCIAVVGATLSRTGIFAVLALLTYFIFSRRSESRSIVFLLICCMLGAGMLLPDLGPILDAISSRASAFNIMKDERGSILAERLAELQQSLNLFLFGRGFMSLGASDNSFLALLHGYGYLGALAALICMLLISGVARGKVRWHPQLGGIFIASFFFLLTGDIFGQAKIVGCFYCLIVARSTLQITPIPSGFRKGTH